MKPELPFSKLPALGELLKHPTVLGVVQRVNQTTVAQRAACFWEELQSGWKEQGGLPSVGELAERLAQRLLGRSQHAAPTVNAAGVLCSRRWHAPLAETAVHELLRFASEYQQPSSELMDQVAASLVLSTRAEAAWVASSFEAALSMTNQCEGATLVSCPLMGLIDPADFGRMHVDTVADRFAAGADLVVLDGSGLLGGPRCGIVVGSQRFVEQLRQSELASALAADPMVLAALEATLEIYRSPEKLKHQIPVLQLLATPLENLQQRCERIAPLLAECEQVASAKVVAQDSIWLDTGSSQLSSASWSIALRPAQGTPERLSHLFSQADPQVVGRVEEDILRLDFRAIFPRWDQHLVAALSSFAAVFCCVVLFFSTATFAQDSLENAAKSSPPQANSKPELAVASASISSDPAKASDPANLTKNEFPKSSDSQTEGGKPALPAVHEEYSLSREQHPWARFSPGAWRDLETATVSFDDSGQMVSRNVTLQTEILETVAEGKYVLKVQATVELGGKRIVGDWKKRTLFLATDRAGLVGESRRLADQPYQLMGQNIECQVWNIHYRDGTRNLIDRVSLTPLQHPFVLRRETLVDPGQPSGAEVNLKAPVEKTDQLTEVLAQAVPYSIDEQLLSCCLLRTYRHRAKGATSRLVYLSKTVPGGEVEVQSTDFNAKQSVVRWSHTKLLAFGEHPLAETGPAASDGTPPPEARRETTAQP